VTTNLNEQIQELESDFRLQQDLLRDIMKKGRSTSDREEKQALIEELDQKLGKLDELRAQLKDLYLERHLKAAAVEPPTEKGWRFPKFW